MTIAKNKITPFRLTLVGLAFIIIARSIIPLIELISQFPLNDFSVYLDGTKATLNGKNPYELWFFDSYNYPPAATLFFIPFTYLPINTAEYLFTALSIISLWFTVTYILYSMIVKLNWPVQLLLFSLTLKLFPVKLTLALGQINLLILLLIIASYYFQSKKPYFSGVLLGLATAIKLTPAPLVIYFLIKKNYRVFLGFIIFIIFINIIAIIVFGFPPTQHYYTRVLPELNSLVSQATLNATYMNQSVTALLGRFGIFGLTNSLIRYVISVFGILLLAIKHKKFTDFQLFSLLIIIITLFLPVFVWQHHYIFVIPALLIMAARREWLLATVFYFLFNWYFRDSGQAVTSHPLLSTHFLSVTILLIAATLLVLRLNHKTLKTRSTQIN